MAKKVRKIDISFLGVNLKAFRKAKNLSMQQLANLAEIEKSQIARIEIGESDPRLSTMIMIADALDVEIKELLKKQP